MNWYRWDFAYLGRGAGGLIIIGGIGLAAWGAIDLPRRVPASYAATSFLTGVLTYAFWGLVVMLVAELAYQMSWRDAEAPEEPADIGDLAADEAEPLSPLLPVGTVWASFNRLNLVQLGRAGGALIVIGGIAVSAWEALVPTYQSSYLSLSSTDAGELFLRNALQFIFYGFVVILVAELADRIGWRDTHAIDEAQVQESDTQESVGAPPLVRMEIISASWNNVKLIRVGRAAGVLIVIGGLILASWDALRINLTTHDAAKLFLANVLQYTFYGFVVILLAEVADRIGQRTEDETGETDEAPEAGPQTT